MSTVDRILRFWFARPLVTWPGLPLPVTTPVECLGRPAVEPAEAPQGATPAGEPGELREEAPRQAA
jgi:hypothetical protein